MGNNCPNVIDRDQAEQRGLNRYFSGIPCKLCGVAAERYVNNSQCLECKRLERKRVSLAKANRGERQIITREAAAELGLNAYFSGEPCKNGHIAERYIRDHKCVECAKKRKRKPKEPVLVDKRARRQGDQAFMFAPPKPTIAGAYVVQGWRSRIGQEE